MGMVVPKVRKHLCADALLRSMQDVFSHIPDHRKGDAEISLGDALMSAFAMFSLKSPSLLAFDKVRAEDNLQVCDHRVASRGRLSSERLVSLAPRTFSSGLGLLAPLYMRHQSDLVVCRLETS